MAATRSKLLLLLTLTLLALNLDIANGFIRGKTYKKINRANRYGPYIGIVVPSQSTSKPLLQNPSFVEDTNITVEVSGRTFRFGNLAGERVVVVVTGSSMINAATTTKSLLSLFRVKGVVHYGLAGSADPSRHIGDVAIPLFWSHLGLWTWQKYGQGPSNELPLEEDGDFTRRYGRLRFADYAVNVNGCDQNDNVLNNIWYQPEEIFPDDETTEEKQHIMWVAADDKYQDLAKELVDLELQKCINSTACLETTPKVARVGRGASASIYVDNAAYSNFLHDKFNVGPVDMESAAVGLISYQENVPFIAMRGIANLAGADVISTSIADEFSSLVVNNAVTTVVEFVKLVHKANITTRAEPAGDFYEPLGSYVDSD